MFCALRNVTISLSPTHLSLSSSSSPLFVPNNTACRSLSPSLQYRVRRAVPSCQWITSHILPLPLINNVHVNTNTNTNINTDVLIIVPKIFTTTDLVNRFKFAHLIGTILQILSNLPAVFNFPSPFPSHTNVHLVFTTASLPPPTIWHRSLLAAIHHPHHPIHIHFLPVLGDTFFRTRPTIGAVILGARTHVHAWPFPSLGDLPTPPVLLVPVASLLLRLYNFSTPLHFLPFPPALVLGPSFARDVAQQHGFRFIPLTNQTDTQKVIRTAGVVVARHEHDVLNAMLYAPPFAALVELASASTTATVGANAGLMHVRRQTLQSNKNMYDKMEIESLLIQAFKHVTLLRNAFKHLQGIPVVRDLASDAYAIDWQQQV